MRETWSGAGGTGLSGKREGCEVVRVLRTGGGFDGDATASLTKKRLQE